MSSEPGTRADHSSGTSAIAVRDLGKCYQRYESASERLRQLVFPGRAGTSKEFWALRDISFDLPKGGSVGIIGKNGSGKSTLLQIICGTTKPTTGRIEVQGRIAALLELGSGFNPDFTGRENVFLNGSLQGLTRDEISDRFEEISDFADIGSFIEQPVKTYSSGMLVRLAFAVQVQVEPDILIIDEALAVGDALFQKRCFQRIESLIDRGTSVLFVSHDEESVRTLTRHAILLKDGRIATQGAPSDVLLEYRRQLHDDESAYLGHRAQLLTRRSSSTPTNSAPPTAASEAAPRRSESLAFGDLEAEVLAVRVLDGAGVPTSVFYPTDPIRVEVDCLAHRELGQLNVALRIRNKEGVKLYSWGTLNQDIAAIATGDDAALFWKRQFAPHERFTVVFEWVCGLGSNLYEIQAAISREGKPYYAEQRMLHWRDEAAFFHVRLDQRRYHFGGAVDLRMRATCSGRTDA